MPTIQITCRPCKGQGGYKVPGQSITEQPGWRTCPVCKGTGNETIGVPEKK